MQYDVSQLKVLIQKYAYIYKNNIYIVNYNFDVLKNELCKKNYMENTS